MRPVILFFVAFQNLLEHMELYATSGHLTTGYLIDLILPSGNGTSHPHRVLQSSQSTGIKDIDCVPVLLKKELDQIQFPRSGWGFNLVKSPGTLYIRI